MTIYRNVVRNAIANEIMEVCGVTDSDAALRAAGQIMGKLTSDRTVRRALDGLLGYHPIVAPDAHTEGWDRG